MNKHLLLASFVFPDKLDSFLTYLENEFKISRNSVFVFENLDESVKLIVTFKIQVAEGERVDIKRIFPGTIIIHKKGNALYTINALNKLIEKDSGLSDGNVDYKSFKVDWNQYQDNIILIRKEQLLIQRIKRLIIT